MTVAGSSTSAASSGCSTISDPRCLRTARARAEPAAALVEADREEVGVGLDDLVAAAAVVHVDGEVGDAMPLVCKPLAGERGVVVRAEAQRAVGMRVMQ